MEIRALLYLNIILLCFYTLGLTAVYFTSPLLRSVRWLLPCFGMSALAMVVIQFCPPGTPCFLLVNLLLLGGYLLLDCGIVELGGRQVCLPRFGIALLLTEAVGHLWMYHHGGLAAERILLFSLLVAAQLIFSLTRLIRTALPETRIAASALALVLSMTTGYYLNRARLSVLALIHAGAALPRLHTPDLVLLTISSTGILFGFLWVTAEKMRLELERMARTDSLTGVLNRRAFEAEFQRETARSQRSGAPLSMLLMDVDHFKFVNDAHGHLAGDIVLRELADLLKKDLRRADLVARLGGEEFAALLPDTDWRQAALTAERLRASIEILDIPSGNACVNVTASFGVTAWRGDGDAWERLLSRVDNAMYKAKEAGRNRVSIL